MLDPIPLETDAMTYAGEQAGEYLESIKKTDLATLSADEWATFCNVMCSGYVEHLQNAIGRIETDLRYLRAKIEPLPDDEFKQA